MGIRIREARVAGVLTRTRGYLEGICSHSLQPYRGCSFGRSLCGVGCYVQHNGLLLRGEAWGSFVDPRVNAAERYRATVSRERRWARRQQGAFGIFLSSATDPFLPQEQVYGVTAALLDAMAEEPPDVLVVQTHSPSVAREQARLLRLARRCALRIHVSIESDRGRLPGLPPAAASVRARLDAARSLRDAGLRTVITVAPLLPIRDPRAFFEQIAAAADAVVIDHFIGGDGSRGGARTLRTALPAAMERVRPGSTSLAYRDEMVRVAESVMPGRVGVSRDGFAGRFLPAASQPEADSSAS